MKLLFWRHTQFPQELLNLLNIRPSSEKRIIKNSFKMLSTSGTSPQMIKESIEILVKLKDYPLPKITKSKENEIVFFWMNKSCDTIYTYFDSRGRLTWLAKFNDIYKLCGEVYWCDELPIVFQEALNRLLGVGKK